MKIRDFFFGGGIVFAMAVFFVGVLGPETGFDALWYHLSEAKMYLLAGRVFHISGGLFYYSEMPRLAEVSYVVGLGRLSYVWPHLLSFAAGFGAVVVTYAMARMFLSRGPALMASLIFYATPLVGWLSGSAYVDLIRTFFESLAFLLVLGKRPVLAGLALGLAISIKTLALGSVGLLLVVAFLVWRDGKKVAVFLLTTGVVCLPWFVGAYLNTGFGFYPIGAGILDQRHVVRLDLPGLIGDFWRLWLAPEDPITMVYLLVLPFLVFDIRRIVSKFWVVGIYFVGSYLIWWATPRTGGGRFILPYLPVWSVLTAGVIFNVRDRSLRWLLVFSVVAIAFVNVGYRAMAEAKIWPYLTGRETKEEYLCRTLDFRTRVFVDCDGWFGRNIKKTDLVLLVGVHNLYYVEFPFVHQSLYRGEEFNYVLVQNGNDEAWKLGGNWTLVHENPKTGVKVFKKV